MTLFCSCGSAAVPKQTRYGIRHTCLACGNWSWGGKPLTDQKTHSARQQAHAAFDPLWQSGTYKRRHAYSALRRTLQKYKPDITKETCHMSVMDAETAQLVVSVIPEVEAQLQNETGGSCASP